jgi:hypothetical protein
MIKINSISEFTHYRDEARLKCEVIRPVLLGQITFRQTHYNLGKIKL